MANIYRPLYLRDFPILTTDLESAEMIKYAANAFLATKITFINEIAALCERTGADVKAVSRGMGLDGRIGNKFLHAGPGYGGSCFPKDTKALARIGQEHGLPVQIVETVMKVNDEVKRRMIDKVVDLCGGSVNGKVIAVLAGDSSWRDLPPQQRLALLDTCVAEGIGGCRAAADPKDQSTLPLAAVPAWEPRSADPAFIASAPCFRPKPAGRIYAGPLRL